MLIYRTSRLILQYPPLQQVQVQIMSISIIFIHGKKLHSNSYNKEGKKYFVPIELNKKAKVDLIVHIHPSLILSDELSAAQKQRWI